MHPYALHRSMASKCKAFESALCSSHYTKLLIICVPANRVTTVLRNKRRAH